MRFEPAGVSVFLGHCGWQAPTTRGYLELAAADLGVEPEMMRHVAPLGWEHLSLTGNYVWDAEDQPAPGELRPLRTKPSLLAA